MKKNNKKNVKDTLKFNEFDMHIKQVMNLLNSFEPKLNNNDDYYKKRISMKLYQHYLGLIKSEQLKVNKNE